MRAGVAQDTENRLRVAELSLERSDVAVGDLVGDQDAHLARAIRERAEHEVDADRGDVEALEGNHARRQPLAPSVLEDHTPAELRIVEHDAGVLAARVAVS